MSGRDHSKLRVNKNVVNLTPTRLVPPSDKTLTPYRMVPSPLRTPERDKVNEIKYSPNLKFIFELLQKKTQ